MRHGAFFALDLCCGSILARLPLSQTYEDMGAHNKLAYQALLENEKCKPSINAMIDAHLQSAGEPRRDEPRLLCALDVVALTHARCHRYER